MTHLNQMLLHEIGRSISAVRMYYSALSFTVTVLESKPNKTKTFLSRFSDSIDRAGGIFCHEPAFLSPKWALKASESEMCAKLLLRPSC